MEVQWYPGHMTKARRMMEENIRLVDLVIELVDARIPLSSRNPDIDALCAGKGRIVLLCKADLADPARTEAFEAFFRKKGILAAAVDARERRAGDLVRRFVQEACREKLERDRARGIIGRPLRAMVAGIPNVGKSTFINSFAGRASAKTGNRPGVTRGKQWIRLSGSLELLDTPGILWPKFDDRWIGMRLALVGAIRDEILDKEELAVWLLDYLSAAYPGIVEEKYLSGTAGQEEALATPDPESAGEVLPAPDPESAEETLAQPVRESGEEDLLSSNPDSGEEAGTIPPGFLLLQRIAAARRLLKKGGEPDTARAAALLLDDCKNGRIGRISLESPRDGEESDARQKAAAAEREASGRTGKAGRPGETGGSQKPLRTGNPGKTAKPGATGKAGRTGKSGGSGKTGGKRDGSRRGGKNESAGSSSGKTRVRSDASRGSSGRNPKQRSGRWKQR